MFLSLQENEGTGDENTQEEAVANVAVSDIRYPLPTHLFFLCRMEIRMGGLRRRGRAKRRRGRGKRRRGRGKMMAMKAGRKERMRKSQRTIQCLYPRDDFTSMTVDLIQNLKEMMLIPRNLC